MKATRSTTCIYRTTQFRNYETAVLAQIERSGSSTERVTAHCDSGAAPQRNSALDTKARERSIPQAAGAR